MYPGDPTTPGYASYENVTRTEGKNIPSIPSLPFSSANAAKLLELCEKSGSVRLLNNGAFMMFPKDVEDFIWFDSGYESYAYLEHDGCYSWIYYG